MKAATEMCESQIVSTIVTVNKTDLTALSDHFGVFVAVQKQVENVGDGARVVL